MAVGAAVLSESAMDQAGLDVFSVNTVQEVDMPWYSLACVQCEPIHAR